MTTSPLYQGKLFRSDEIHLFESEVKPSRVLTIINRILVGTGAMLFTTVPVWYWITKAPVTEEDFELFCCSCSMPTFEERTLTLVCFNVFAALLEVFFYWARIEGSEVLHPKEGQESKPMKDVQWKESNPLSNVKVAAPCPADWRWMYGNDRVRFCNQCRLNVYNLSAMTKPEAEDLIRNTEGRLCVRFYRRSDGTILTQNCPVGLRAIKKKLSHFSAVTITALLSFLANIGLLWWIDKNNMEEGVFSIFVANPHESNLYITTGVLAFPGSLDDQPIVKRKESFIREKAIFKVSPIYHTTNPIRIMGDVVVKIIINEDGEVENAELIKGHPILKGLVEEAASRWKFRPMLSIGLPTKIESQLTFHFGQ